MRRYRIQHTTSYTYEQDVELGEHFFLLRPRTDHEIRLESFLLTTEPAATVRWHRDVEDNSVAIATFSQPTSKLVVAIDVVIHQFNDAPLDFVVEEYAMNYPFNYLAREKRLLAPYTALPQQDQINAINHWVAGFWQHGEAIQTYSLLQRMAEHIYGTFRYQVREEPGVQSGAQTLALGTGSCRDFAWLFIQTARCLGLAARFVSGYLYAPLMPAAAGATHAWAEVYLPGAGWLAFDPTIGDIVGSDHITVAVSNSAEAVPPIQGSFIGTSGARMAVSVQVSQYAEDTDETAANP